MTKICENDFKEIVRQYLGNGILPTPSLLNMELRRHGQSKNKYNNINGRQTKWRREVLQEFGYVKVDGRWVRHVW